MSKTNYELQYAWKAKKKAQGFKNFQVFIPEPLFNEIKQYMRDWKAKNPTFYEKK
jgi:hypothetical protein